MAENKEIKKEENLFVVHSEEINNAYERAVREALIKHRKLGNYVVVERAGEIVKLKGEEIDELLK